MIYIILKKKSGVIMGKDQKRKLVMRSGLLGAWAGIIFMPICLLFYYDYFWAVAIITILSVILHINACLDKTEWVFEEKYLTHRDIGKKTLKIELSDIEWYSIGWFSIRIQTKTRTIRTLKNKTSLNILLVELKNNGISEKPKDISK